MDRLFHVIVLDVGDDPEVPGVLAKGVAGILACFRPLEIFFAGILLGHPHRVEVEDVIVGLGEPDDGLVPAGKYTSPFEIFLLSL